MDPFVGVVECLKGYGRVLFGQDGFCPVAGYSVYTTACSRCAVPSKWPAPAIEAVAESETAGPKKRKTVEGERGKIRGRSRRQ